MNKNIRKALGIGSIVALLVASFAGGALAQTLSFKFDFGAGPVEEGYIGVGCKEAYDPQKGYGFLTTDIDGRDRGEAADALRRDFCNHKTLIPFQVDLPNGSYRVRVIVGDQIATQAESQLVAEGQTVIERVAAPSGTYFDETFVVQVRDGSLNLEFQGTNTVRINGLIIEAM